MLKNQLLRPRRKPKILLQRPKKMPRKQVTLQRPRPKLLLPLHQLPLPLLPPLLLPLHQLPLLPLHLHLPQLLQLPLLEHKNIDNEQQRVIYNRVEWCSQIAVNMPQTLTERSGMVSTAPAIIMIGKQSNDIC